MKMLARYYGVELKQAVLSAQLGTSIVSPYDPGLVQDAIGGVLSDGDAELNAYQQLRSTSRTKSRGFLRRGTHPHAGAGRGHQVGGLAAPAQQLRGLCARDAVRVFAAATGVSVEQVTQDWSKTNYSSARAALMETWKTLDAPAR